MKIKTNYITQENSNHLIQYIRDFINNNEEVIIVNIGTDKMIYDVLSPLLGTILKENNCSLTVYGTIDNPIHAMNLKDRLEKIKKLHPNAKIISTDACLGAEADIGDITVRNEPIKPGKGVGKTLPSVGDISIVGVVDESFDNDLFKTRNTRLDLIYKMATTIADIILTACDSSSKNILLYNRNKSDAIELNTYKEVAVG